MRGAWFDSISNTKYSAVVPSPFCRHCSMALLLETTLGDIVIDLDVEGSPELCKNVLKLAKARYYTSSLVYNVQVNRFCQLGDPHGDGSGGACIYGLISSLSKAGELRMEQRILKSQQRFLKSNMGRPLTADECREKGRVVATEMKGVSDTIGSQLLITTCSPRSTARRCGSSTAASADRLSGAPPPSARGARASPRVHPSVPPDRAAG